MRLSPFNLLLLAALAAGVWWITSDGGPDPVAAPMTGATQHHRPPTGDRPSRTTARRSEVDPGPAPPDHAELPSLEDALAAYARNCAMVGESLRKWAQHRERADGTSLTEGRHQ